MFLLCFLFLYFVFFLRFFVFNVFRVLGFFLFLCVWLVRVLSCVFFCVSCDFFLFCNGDGALCHAKVLDAGVDLVADRCFNILGSLLTNKRNSRFMTPFFF